jgi:hypothetical protein
MRSRSGLQPFTIEGSMNGLFSSRLTKMRFFILLVGLRRRVVKVLQSSTNGLQGYRVRKPNGPARRPTVTPLPVRPSGCWREVRGIRWPENRVGYRAKDGHTDRAADGAHGEVGAGDDAALHPPTLDWAAMLLRAGTSPIAVYRLAIARVRLDPDAAGCWPPSRLRGHARTRKVKLFFVKRSAHSGGLRV